MSNTNKKVFVVYNPKAGKEEQADEIRAALARHFTPPEWTSEIYQTTGKEDLAAICREACQRDVSLVVAAGGDGTVVGVANGLINSKIPLGLVPLGTGNDLARVLKVPLELDKALDLLVSDHDVITMDALKVKDRYFFSNVSAGFTPQMMKDTPSAQKKRFGRIAYLWTMFKQSRIFQLRRYTLTIDGQKQRVRASEVLISNTTLLEGPTRLFGPPETLKDGQLEAYLVTARTPGDYLHLIWDVIRHRGRRSEKLHHWQGKNSIRIDADRSPQLVQADGEVIGHTPVEVQMVQRALHVIMPKPEATAAPG
jgi:YegS/Rv2252/BmrU family lipid kinase